MVWCLTPYAVSYTSCKPYVWPICNTPSTVSHVPNAPKTPNRSIRVPDERWHAAQQSLAEGETITDLINALLAWHLREKGAKPVKPANKRNTPSE